MAKLVLTGTKTELAFGVGFIGRVNCRKNFPPTEVTSVGKKTRLLTLALAKVKAYSSPIWAFKLVRPFSTSGV